MSLSGPNALPFLARKATPNVSKRRPVYPNTSATSPVVTSRMRSKVAGSRPSYFFGTSTFQSCCKDFLFSPFNHPRVILRIGVFFYTVT